jgi:MYXO-CTERM domain-containing protein
MGAGIGGPAVLMQEPRYVEADGRPAVAQLRNPLWGVTLALIGVALVAPTLAVADTGEVREDADTDTDTDTDSDSDTDADSDTSSSSSSGTTAAALADEAGGVSCSHGGTSSGLLAGLGLLAGIRRRRR